MQIERYVLPESKENTPEQTTTFSEAERFTAIEETNNNEKPAIVHRISGGRADTVTERNGSATGPKNETERENE